MFLIGEVKTNRKLKMINKEKAKKILEKQGYRIIRNNSAVKICNWTRKSLRNEGNCYKEKFYGIKSHLCAQITCSLFNCQNKCLHCWRNLEYTEKVDKKNIDEPKEIIEGCIKQQRKLLSGFKGSSKTNLKKLKESQNPQQFAISLSGEPTLYPKLGELIKGLRKQNKTSFLVTNGLCPNKLLELQKQNALPTQLYLSLNAPNKKLYDKIHRSSEKNAWKKFNQSLKLFPKLKTRKVIRMTLVKELNIDDKIIKDYAKLILKAKPDFIEVKGFMSVGFARQRKNMGYDMMPNHREIKSFTKKLLKFLPSYKFLDEQIASRVVLLGKDKKMMKIKQD